jgi:PAS domain S-box-containing protein
MNPNAGPDSASQPENPEQMADLLSAIFNAFPSHIAIIDHTGKILLVNSTWREFAHSNCLHGPAFSVKRNYLEIGEQIQGPAAADARRAVQGIRQVLNGEVPEFILDYPSPSEQEQRWFRLWAVPLRHTRRTGAILLHTEITERKLAEDKLRHEHDLLRAVIDHLPDAIYTKGIAARKTMSNPGDLKSMGFASEAEALGKTAFELFPRELAEQFYRDDQTVIQTGQPVVNREERIPLPDGGTRLLLTTKLPLRDSAGDIIGLIGLGRDITEQKRAEEKIRASEASMAAAQHIARTGSWEVELAAETFCDTDRHLWSDETYRIYGFEPGAVTPTTKLIFERIHPDDHELLKHVINKAIGERSSYSTFHRIRLPDGEIRYVHRRGKVVVDEQTGRPVKIIGTIHDITERRLIEERLREQASLLNQTTDAIIVRDLDDTIRFWSRGAQRTYGWEDTEAVGRKLTDFVIKDPVKFAQASEALHSTGRWNGEQRHRTKGGAEIIVESRWTILPDDLGQPKSILAINTDITERKRLEAQFLRAQRLESIGKLASGIAHDLNNVLTPILVSISVLRERVQPEDAETLDNLEASAKRGADIIRQLLLFGRGAQTEHETLHPSLFLREIETILRETFPKTVQSEVTFDPNLWQVVGNHTQLHQVLLNLCVNARDAMPGGGRIRISAQNVYLNDNYAHLNPDCKKGPYVMIQVSDTGEGIPADIREKVFEPFFTTKEVGKGTGLGLSTSLAIIKSHHGLINLYSEVGKGTTFKLYLPACQAPSEEVWQTRTADLPHGNGQTILLVDDEKTVLNVTRKTLERYGYKVITAEEGASAVAAYAQHQQEIAVVITDMVMPVMDGRVCIHALQQINPNVKIIAASGLGPDSGYIKAVESGVKHFLSKPYTAEAVLRMLQELLAP